MAPYGRVTSGRGFAPTGVEPYDLPAAGHFTRDLSDITGKASTEAWLRQAKMTKSLPGMHKRTNPNQIPSVMPGLHPSHSLGQDTRLASGQYTATLSLGGSKNLFDPACLRGGLVALA